jgi:hypothetical protein
VEYVAAGTDFLRELLAHRHREPDRLILFPFPNTPPKLRAVAVPSFPDLLLLWVYAGRIGRVTDGRLSSRVFGRRLAGRVADGSWRFRNPRRAWENFVAMVQAQAPSQGAVGNTDVANYYGTVRLDLLERQLRDIGAPRDEVQASVAMFEAWQDRDGLRGLPVGLDSSSVLGTAFLRDVDVELERRKVRYGRWVDDIVTVGEGRAECRAAIDVAAFAVGALGLKLSELKTFVDNKYEGINRLRSRRISLIEAVGRSDPELEPKLVGELFDEQLAAGDRANGRVVKWLLGHLNHDRYAAYRIAQNPDFMNVDPAATARFFKAVFAKKDSIDDRVAPLLCELLKRPANERTHALRLHILRVVRSGVPVGDSERDLFDGIARDCDEPIPVRAWALHAYSASPTWDPRHVMEVAEADVDSRVRRPAILALKGSVGGRSVRRFLEHMRVKFPEVRLTTEYVRRAA